MSECVAKVASHPPQSLSSTSFTLSLLSSQTQVQQQHTLLALPVQNQASGTCFAFHKFFFPPKNHLFDFFFLQHHQKNPKERNTTHQQHQHPRLIRPSENKSAEIKQKLDKGTNDRRDNKAKKQTDMGGLLHGPHHTRAARKIEGRRPRNCSCSSPNS